MFDLYYDCYIMHNFFSLFKNCFTFKKVNKTLNKKI